LATPLDALSFREIYGRTLRRPERGVEHAFVVAPLYDGMTRREENAVVENVRKSLYRCVDYGEVFYVSREMTEYLMGIVNNPRNRQRQLWHLDQEDLPSLTGFVYFDGPVPMPTIYSKTGSQDLVAVLWDQFTHDDRPSAVTGKPGLYFGQASDPPREVVGKIIYSVVESPSREARDLYGPWKPRHWIPAVYGQRWEPSMVNWNHSHEPPGIHDNLSPIDQERDQADSEEAMRILMRLLEAWCLVIKQEIPVLHPRPSNYDKVMHKEGRPPADVKVTHLRRYEQRPATGLVEVDWQYRWRVKQHQRLQRVGPGRAFTRMVWVKSYVKGPPDKPLVERDTITSLDR
jgi:hypothetical protein